MSSTPMYTLVDQLPAKNMTVRLLNALDWIVPGQWTNIVGFDNTIKTVTGEDNPAMIKKIGERAVQLYNDKTQGYQRAVWLYQTADTIQGAAGMAAFANKLGQNVGFLSFMEKLTPKPMTTQGIDLCVKFAAEIIAFTQINGIPGEGFADFVKSLSDYQNEALMRMAAVICFDGILPFGPAFLDKGLSYLQSTGVGDLQKNERFSKVASMIPGDGVQNQMGFLQKSMTAVTDWTHKFVASRDLGVDKIVGNIRSVIPGVESKLEYFTAFVDLFTNYFEHTGIQTVARALITRAVSEI
jgi:hypothetical protein